MLVIGGESTYYLYFNDIWIWKYDSSFFYNRPIPRGNAGIITGIAYGSIWGAIFLSLAVIYCPKKRKTYKMHSRERSKTYPTEIYICKISCGTKEIEIVTIKIKSGIGRIT